MKCLFPIKVPKRDYSEIRDAHKIYINVPCGKCIPCLENKRNAWTFRLLQELKVSKTAKFITLTYSDEELPDNGLNKRDVQLFLKRLRRFIGKDEHYDKIKYYIVGELGTRTKRPHYHGIFFNIPEYITNGSEKIEQDQILTSIWKKGFIMIGTVTTASIHYTTGYMMGANGKEPAHWAIMSKGLGKSYIDITKKFHKEGKYFYTVSETGHKMSMSKYYKDKIFTKEEKEENRIKLSNIVHKPIKEERNNYEYQEKLHKQKLKNKKNKSNNKLL